MAENDVDNWLKSLDLGKYTQSFIDNGYDDLDICKQVGEPDLDAIGVQAGADRAAILEAVTALHDKAGPAGYVTLEDDSTPDGRGSRPSLENLIKDAPPPPSPGPDTGAGSRPGSAAAAEGRLSASLVAYPKLQLAMALREKLIEDGVDLSSPPYTGMNLSPCWSSLTALAVKYAEDMHTYLEDVLERLEDLRWWKITEDTNSVYSPPSMTGSPDPYYPAVFSPSPRGGPPPIPIVPPPEASHLDQYGEMTSVQTRYNDSPSHANYVALEAGGADMEKKKTSTLGRLFRNMGFRRSSRKHSYKKHQGDLVAHEITMGDGDRIALMQMVKEGKITTETALQVVKRFEEERKREEAPYEHHCEKPKKGESRKSKKSQSLRPSKSPSLYTDDDCICEMCNTMSPSHHNLAPGHHNLTPGHAVRGYQCDCCRHRRVHSVSHIAHPDSIRTPETGRAVSCSPMRSHSTHASSTLNSPSHSKIYTPVIPHELKMYSGGSRALYAVHGIDVLRDRLNVIKTNACVHKTQSKASLISSESDHSMECSMHAVNHTEPHIDETYFCSNASTVSLGSDTAPAVNGRRKCGSTMEKLRTHKWQRTGSVSAGEDGMSTDNDDLDDPDRHLLGGGSSGASHMMERFRDVKNEMRKRILHTRDIIGDGKSQHLSSAYQSPCTSHSVSSNDSCHSASSGHGSQSSAHMELPWPQPWIDLDHHGHWVGPIVGHARVHSDYIPAPDEKDFIHLRRGERVQILETCPSGIWRGVVENRVGYFHFNFIDMVMETTPLSQRKDKARRRTRGRSKPRSVEELLQRIGLEHLGQVFMMNGYDSLEIFAEIDHDDLNALNILDSESRTKLLTAAQLLMDYEAVDVMEPSMERAVRTPRSASATPTSASQQYAVPWTSFFPAKPSAGSRDSGCYDSNEFMNRDGAGVDGYACINRGRGGQQDNKENQRPRSGQRGLRMGLAAPDTPAVASANGAKLEQKIQNVQSAKPDNNVGNGGKLEKIYSVEDREVCDITGYQGAAGEKVSPQTHSAQLANVNNKVPDTNALNRNLTLNIEVPLGPDWQYVVNASTQTTSTYASLSESYHPSVDGDLNNLNASMATSIHADYVGHRIATLKFKSKPYPRKITPPVPVRDAQVQVMRPLGNFTHPSPPSNPPQTTLIDSKSFNRQSSAQSTVSTTGSSLSVTDSKALETRTVSQSTVLQTGPSVILQNGSTPRSQTAPLVNTSAGQCNDSEARVSLVSQTSQGDSESDASTVKSDKVVENGQSGQSGDSMGGASPDFLHSHIQKGFKSIKRSVIPKVTSKLAAENIDLAKEPYSSQCGACGVPPLLVQRYSEELKQDLYRVALILDQVRVHKLTTVGRPAVVAEKLTETSLATSELKIASVPEFFISIGLPMYADVLMCKGYTSVETLIGLSVRELQAITKADRKHLKRIVHALEWVQKKLASPNRKVSPMKDKV